MSSGDSAGDRQRLFFSSASSTATRRVPTLHPEVSCMHVRSYLPYRPGLLFPRQKEVHGLARAIPSLSLNPPVLPPLPTVRFQCKYDLGMGSCKVHPYLHLPGIDLLSSAIPASNAARWRYQRIPTSTYMIRPCALDGPARKPGLAGRRI
jgi:hypothetical protein